VYVGKDEIDRALQPDAQPLVRFVFPIILGCINYRFPFGPKDGHQTGIILTLNRIAHEPPNPGVSVGIDPRLGTIEPENLRLTISHWGSYAD
jgi:hypothetical protein